MTARGRWLVWLLIAVIAAMLVVMRRRSATERTPITVALPARTNVAPVPERSGENPGASSLGGRGSAARPAPGVAMTLAERRVDPRTPEYDPMLAATMYHHDAIELFEREWRDPAFADRREAYLAKALVPRFHTVVSDGEVEDIECRVSMCKIRIRVADNPEDYARLQLAWGDAVTVEPASTAGPDPGYRTVDVYALSSAEHRDHDRFEAVSAELLAERDPDQASTDATPAP